MQSVILSSRIRYLDAWGTRYVQYTDKGLALLLKRARTLKILEICNQAGIKFRAGVFKNIFALSLEKIDMRGLEISASAAGLK